MNAEIICVGTELLLGHIVNTNASFIAKKLAEIGVDHYFQSTVGDNPRRLAAAIRDALSRSDAVIITGGLGPTVDDITTRIIAGVTDKKLVSDKSVLSDINEFFIRLKRKCPRPSLRQALVPEGAKCLKNPWGTAPGLIIERGSKVIIALPGPPREMRPMVTDLVVPYLRSKVGPGHVIKSKSIKLMGLAEAEVDEKVRDLLSLSGPVQVGIYAKQGEVELKVTAKAASQKAADAKITKVEKVIKKRVSGYVYGTDSETMEEVVGRILTKKKKTLAVAESCTGGLAADLITNIPGSSKYFKEGVVAYSNASKARYLNIPLEMIKKYGAVSGRIAKRMAAGIRNNSGADIGIGITGIAGPTGATKTKPTGLVYIALSTKNRRLCKRFNFLGSRSEIKSQAAMAALNMIRTVIGNNH